MLYNFYKFLILLYFTASFLACNKVHEPLNLSQPLSEPAPEQISQPDHLASWFLENHADKIAHHDKNRNIFQIKVLNQITLGARQCGYHAIRNMFYLSALSLAIKQQDSNLINKLYAELHNVNKYEAFVNALAELKGCPLEYYHQDLPNKEEFIKLYAKAPEGFPSSFGIKEILFYALPNNLTPFFIFYKSPTKEQLNKTELVEFISEYSLELGVDIVLNDKHKKLLSVYPLIGSSLIKDALDRLENKLLYAFEITLLGQPSHGVSASAFRDQAKKLFMLFADSWGNLSFKSGWSKDTINLLYNILSNPNESIDKMLILEAENYIGKDRLLPSDALISSKDLFALISKDKAKKVEAINNLKAVEENFEGEVKKLGLKKAPLYPLIRELIKKMRERLGVDTAN